MDRNDCELRHPPSALLRQLESTPLIPSTARVVIGYMRTLSKRECEVLECRKAIAALQIEMKILDPVRVGRENQHLTLVALEQQVKQKRKVKQKQSKKRAKNKWGKASQPPDGIKLRRKLIGHYGRIQALHWANDSRHMISTSDRAIVWNAFTGQQLRSFPLREHFNFTCAFSPSGSFVATGGSQQVKIYDSGVHTPVDDPHGRLVCHKLTGHEGYVSCVRFLSDVHILSASGDSFCILWDIPMQTRIATFQGHSYDVSAIDIHPTDPNLFISGARDETVKLWDVRQMDAALTFTGHEADVNAVTFFPDGNALASGSDDTSCRLWDVRAVRQLAIFQDESIPTGVSALSFSARGDRLFAGYDQQCWVWNVTTGALVDPALVLRSQGYGRMDLMVSPDGKALSISNGLQLTIWA